MHRMHYPKKTKTGEKMNENITRPPESWYIQKISNILHGIFEDYPQFIAEIEDNFCVGEDMNEILLLIELCEKLVRLLKLQESTNIEEKILLKSLTDIQGKEKLKGL